MKKPFANVDEGWTLVLKPRSRFFSFNLREFLHYRDLIILFVKRDIQTVYKQTILGPLWFIIQPIMTTIIYSFIFGNLAKLSTDGIPRTLFYFGGTMLWTYFQTTLLAISDTFVHNAHLFGKVYFPRLAVPASKILSNMVSLSIQIATLAGFYVYYVATGSSIRPNWAVFLLPLIVLWLAALAAGFGMIVSALATKYRDLRQLLQFGMHLWMYATPIVYPMSQLSPKLQAIMWLNPVSAPIELFRSVTYGLPTPASSFFGLSAAITLAVFSLGLFLFHRNEATFVDVV
jgi:lipopolysaccharide transport system permease protein